MERQASDVGSARGGRNGKTIGRWFRCQLESFFPYVESSMVSWIL